tara:strand:- start:242 stop:427 length:186 start_codon:yes stop_codon:yes gene_type:complete
MIYKRFYTQYYKRYFNKIFKNDKILLGRWNTKHKKEQIDRKIYLANHDNCGPCGNVLDKHK